MSTMRARLTEQMPWVGTPTQKERILTEAERDGQSQAEIVRRAVDAYFGLVDGEEPELAQADRPL